MSTLSFFEYVKLFIEYKQCFKLCKDNLFSMHSNTDTVKCMVTLNDSEIFSPEYCSTLVSYLSVTLAKIDIISASLF